MAILDVGLTSTDAQFCESWLSNYNRMVASITHDQFTELKLKQLIVYEATTRKRKDLLRRLISRYFKLQRLRETQDIFTLCNGGN